MNLKNPNYFLFLLQSVLENLPGVDPQSEAVRDAVGSLSKDEEKKTDDDASKK